MRFLSFFLLVLISFHSSVHAIDSKKLKNKILAYKQKGNWAHKSIKQNLSEWAEENLHPKELMKQYEQASQTGEQLAVFEFVDSKVSCYFDKKHSRTKSGPERYKYLFDALEQIQRHVNIPDCFFVISLEDSNDTNVPFLTFAKNEKCTSILIPDFEALIGYKKIKKNVLDKSKISPWHSKKNQIFWRGGATGGFFELDNFHLFPRAMAVHFSLAYPEVLDARLTNFIQASSEAAIAMRDQGFYSSHISIEDSIEYRYLLDIDGNSCTYSRMYWILLSNSMLLKIESPNKQWYYPLLENRKNYVLIKSNFSNLKEEFDFYSKNQEKAQQIAQAGTQLALDELEQEACLAYLYCVISEISEMQKKFYKN